MTTDALKDPRCPYCKHPVLGDFAQGVEGRYHGRCVMPPDVTTHVAGTLSVSQENASIHVDISEPAKHELTEDDTALQGEFLELLAGRLKAGAIEHGNASFDKEVPETVDEIMEELIDIPGWIYTMWVHLNRRMHGILVSIAKVKMAMQLIAALDAYEMCREHGHDTAGAWNRVLQCREYYVAVNKRAEETRAVLSSPKSTIEQAIAQIKAAGFDSNDPDAMRMAAEELLDMNSIHKGKIDSIAAHFNLYT